ncbi:MAG: hypothetical protein AB9895_00750 [Negativicutes bacterium]
MPEDLSRIYEDKAIQDIYKLFGKNNVVVVSKTDYGTHPDFEKRGINLLVILDTGKTMTIQIKSRSFNRTDFCFEVYKKNGKWSLKPTHADWVMFYLTKDSKKPYCVLYSTIQKIWLDYYDELEQNIKPNNNGNGYCVYVNPGWFRNKYASISKDKASIGRLFGHVSNTAALLSPPE